MYPQLLAVLLREVPVLVLGEAPVLIDNVPVVLDDVGLVLDDVGLVLGDVAEGGTGDPPPWKVELHHFMQAVVLTQLITPEFFFVLNAILHIELLL